MALTGLAIYKHLPRTNCKECGIPTCLAFAMKVASGQAGLDECPHMSEEGRAALGEASAPPQRLVKVGADPNPIEIGQETVLFRHDEKFHHPTAVALKLSDNDSEDALKASCAAFKELQFTRVGETLHADMIALDNESGSPDKLAAAAELVKKELGVPLILMSENVEALSAAATGPLSGAKPLLYCTAKASADDLAALAEKAKAPLCVTGELQEIADCVQALSDKGVKDIFIAPNDTGAAKTLAFLTQTRRATLTKKFRSLGCPVLVVACGEDKTAGALDACAYVAKYAGIVVSDAWEPYLLLPILTTRQNIYTDPQKPVQVEPQLYDIGEVTEQSPLLVTTNFSLSYYSVESEVEASRVPSSILAVDTEGTSVLTAWAADKFNPESIAAAIKASGAEEKFPHKKLVLPGHVAVLAASLAEESGGRCWSVQGRLRESGRFLRMNGKAPERFSVNRD